MPDSNEHKGMALFLLCLVQFMVVLDIAIVNVALPSIQNSLHFSETNLSWVINAYTLTFGGLLLLGGRAGRPAGTAADLHRRPFAVLGGVRAHAVLRTPTRP